LIIAVFHDRLHSVHVQKSRWPSARSWSKPVSVGPSG
jgi:hypothetical protein